MNQLVTNPLSALIEVVVNGLPVTYYECGRGEPMLLLHGWPQTSYIWRKVLPALAAHYRVLAVDLPGMGNSHATPTADTQSVAAFLKAWCDQLGLAPLHLVGHDVGAWVAVTFALDYEASLRSLTILDAGIPGLIPEEVFSPLNAEKVWQFYFHAIDGMPEFLIAGKEKEYLRWYFTKKAAVEDAITEADIAVYTAAYTGQERLHNGFAYYRAFAESAAQNKAYQHQLNLPILAIGGEQAQATNVGRAMQKIAGQAVKSVSIPQCGHYIVEEQPEQFVKLLLDFLP
jgi:pimeloyl-ACP methyl ester carboxylesterase